ncbi:MAG: alanine--tRNA ligase [Gaiellaceae bacterium]
MRTTAELREGFLAYFESKGHKRLPSWSLVPRADDRSTLLTSAGMQPQMPFFLGLEEPPAPLTTTAQKCFRTPDIDEVGLDGHHLTFFEMLGNFSFGRYFKDGAIEYATEFVREQLKLDWERIWVTVHAGDPDLGLGEDETAIELWERIGMPRERIVRLPSSENFWSVGGPGPCGPDSEIYFDYGEEYGCGEPGCAPACPRCDRFLEFWNLVFMEYELRPDGTLTPLPQQNVDTGLGLERTAAVVQDVRSVYETDGYQAIMQWIEAESGVAWNADERATKAHRVLADHGRGMTVLVGDGVLPSNEGRGYVLRRIIRRAVQHARAIGLDDLWRLSDIVVDQMGAWYPELLENRRHIQDVVRAEEERFSETLARGMRLFEDVAAKGDVSGGDAFTLTATYGFPVELTKELARERGLQVDEEEFTRLMAEHREISRAGAGRGAARAAEFAREAGFPTEFVGYEKIEALTQIGALEPLEEGLFLCKLRESPFYAEGGGQVTDHGFVEHGASGARALLREAYRFGGDQVLVFEGDGFAAGDRVRAVVPWKVRFPTMANHTATHLLHKALQEVLGDHVRQAGSAVRPDKLRFDFTHPQALTHEERARVEEIVNARIFENLPVHAFLTPLEEARNLGAMMLFGEKYGDVVRVVEIPDFSRELCGGTHVRTTAEVGAFTVFAEGSVGSGVRRIEAVTSGEAYAYLRGQAHRADELAAELEQARKEAKRKPERAEALALTGEREQEVNGVRIYVAEVEGADAEKLLEVSDREKQRRSPAAVVLGARANGRVHLVANFDDNVVELGANASDVVKAAAALVGGGGGGRPTMARAGGSDPEKLAEALAEAERALVEALS